MKKIITLIFICIMLGSCATQTTQIQERSPAYPSSSDMQFFLFWGLGQTDSANADQICGGSQRVSKIVTEKSFVDTLFTLITIGIVSPNHVYVYC